MLGFFPYKNTIQKMLVFFPYKNLLCSAHTKNCHTFLLCIFPYKNYYVLHAKKSHTKNVSVFPIQKLLCSAHTKNHIQKITIQKFTMYSHTQKLPYKKC